MSESRHVEEIRWERRPSDHGPDGYWSADSRWGILPTSGEHTWDLIDFSHDGAELVDVYDHVAAAKARAQRECEK